MATLPRGRHGLSRAEVAADQRERMFHALAAAMTERGYVATPVAEVIKRAGVSRETFYQHFGSKQECFIAAYDWATDALRAGLATGLTTSGTPLERFGVLLGRYLGALAEDPDRARLFLVEVYAAGPEAMRRRVAVQQEAAATLAEVVGARTEQERFACEALLAATVQLVTARIGLGEPEALADLHPPLVALAATLFPS
ncbi:TetR/AcrR family transcriptional regulator [Nocardioides nitrophenolicus]|uniref:TetR/AcrR family transcriptional regulator n=1 Tax=Nocardioides nitrophenolicus TaxID=60489 RepID=UPI00195EDA74|nr:TetR/AcrR family transcriptional regulator [Nocardioides nitrophenolicus]MBM7515173.1 AcrR family transcriptional regulator [Nocardioides nitrophenolicus]